MPDRFNIKGWLQVLTISSRVKRTLQCALMIFYGLASWLKGASLTELEHSSLALPSGSAPMQVADAENQLAC
ncbi:hypothetical protein BDW68DRAFT_101320 [Aspergillus falconensis]